MSDDTLAKMAAAATAWLATDMARTRRGDPDLRDFAPSLMRGEGAGLRLSNNTWRAGLVAAHRGLALVTWLVLRGVCRTRRDVTARLGLEGDALVDALVDPGVLAVAYDGETLAATMIGQRAGANLRDLDEAAAPRLGRGPLYNTALAQGLALGVNPN